TRSIGAPGAADSARTMPCLTRGGISGAPPQACSRTCMKGCSAMIRVVLENILLFLLPTAIYFGYVLLMRRPSTATANAVVNEAPLVWLFIAGAVLVVGTLVYYATIPPRGSPGQVS